MSQIILNYTPQITSSVANSSPFICHRVCYRQVGETDYCCIDDDTDSVSGTPKTFTITLGSGSCSPEPAVVDPQSCVITGYEGYIQACCEDISSTEGRTYWTADFQPEPDCVNQLVCCNTPRAIALADTLNVTTAGSGYTPGDLAVTIVRHPSDPIPAGGTNDASITVGIGGGGALDGTFGVVSGGLYGKTPYIVVPAPGGPGVTGKASFTMLCSALDSYIGDCEETGPNQIFPLLGECTSYCLPKANQLVYSDAGLTTPNPDYTYTPGGCCDCTTCKNWTVAVNSALTEVTICYTECETVQSPITGGLPVCITSPLTPGSSTITINCAVPGSIYCLEDPNAIISIVEGSPADCASCP